MLETHFLNKSLDAQCEKTSRDFASAVDVIG